jgi:predicted esterase
VRTTKIACGILTVAVCLLMPAAHAQSDTRADAAFEQFWAADSPAEAGKCAEAMVKSGLTFDDALRRLKQGRVYKPQKSGVIHLSNTTSDGVEHNFAVNVPSGYDPARRYQVRFQLHGGVTGRTDNKERGTGEIGPLAGAEQIYVLPFSWDEEPWWSDDNILNLNQIVDTLKRTWNVDENRIALSGVSDGATGSYYIAMRDTTPFASFLPLNGFIMVLASGEIDDGRIFPNNLLNKPLFVVNGGKDRLYPTDDTEPFTQHLIRSGVVIDYHPQPEGEHNTKWWPEVKDSFESFVTAHPRDPHPDKLTWETADPVNNRAHWLVIDEISTDAEAKPAELPDANQIVRAENPLYIETRGAMFRRQEERRGRVDLVRTGNTVTAATSGVGSFTLLLSPDKFDFAQPIKVVANGKEVFNGRVQPDLATLLKWAARDNDRTMLYGAELKIKVR